MRSVGACTARSTAHAQLAVVYAAHARSPITRKRDTNAQDEIFSRFQGCCAARCNAVRALCGIALCDEVRRGALLRGAARRVAAVGEF